MAIFAKCVCGGDVQICFLLTSFFFSKLLLWIPESGIIFIFSFTTFSFMQDKRQALGLHPVTFAGIFILFPCTLACLLWFCGGTEWEHQKKKKWTLELKPISYKTKNTGWAKLRHILSKKPPIRTHTLFRRRCWCFSSKRILECFVCI